MKKILIVEDFDFIRSEFVRKLDRFFEIYEAAETNQAKELIKVHTIDIIILDSKLRYTNPYDFIDELALYHPTIRVLAFLNESTTDMLNLFIQHGVKEYLFKSDSQTDLLKKLNL